MVFFIKIPAINLWYPRQKKDTIGLLFFYRPNENASRTDLTNEDQKAHAFAPTYGDGFTAFCSHMISVVVFSYSNTLQSMLVNYVVTDMGWFNDYLDSAPHAKTMRVNGITNFLLQVSQCVTFNQTKFVAATLISEARLKSLYSRLSFKFIKDFAAYPNFEEAREHFHYESGKNGRSADQFFILHQR